MRSEQKNGALIKDLGHKFSNSFNFSLHALAKTRSTLNLWLLLEKDRILAQGNNDGSFVEKQMGGLLEVHNGQLLKDIIDLKRGKEMMEAAQAYLTVVEL